MGYAGKGNGVGPHSQNAKVYLRRWTHPQRRTTRAQLHYSNGPKQLERGHDFYLLSLKGLMCGLVSQAQLAMNHCGQLIGLKLECLFQLYLHWKLDHTVLFYDWSLVFFIAESLSAVYSVLNSAVVAFWEFSLGIWSTCNSELVVCQ